jgi:hypothetical protein
MTDYMLDPPEDREAEARDSWLDNTMLEEMIEPDEAYDILTTLISSPAQAQRELEKAMDKAWDKAKQDAEDSYWDAKIDAYESSRAA